MTATNKRLLISESCGDSKLMYILQGKTQPTRHTLPTLSPCMVQDHTYLTWSTYSNPLRSHQQSWAGPLLPRKRAPDTINNTLADRSAGPYPVSPSSQPMKQWGKAKHLLTVATRLTGPINTSMRSVRSILPHGANPLVLNRHRRGLQPWRCQLTTYHSLTFPTSYLHFTPKGPAQSPV
jgi:hypothetical protein